VPTDQAFPDGSVRAIASADDLTTLELMLVGHFDGISVLAPYRGIGARDAKNPQVHARECC
jgi:hypothetical protein